MKLIAIIILLGLMHSNIPASKTQSDSGSLTINISNITENRGKIRIGIYKDKNTFLKPKMIYKGVERVVTEKGDMLVVIDDLPYGEYVVAIYHDQNNNNKLNTNWLGIPTEPYGFSKKPVSRWRAPEFDEVSMDFTPANNSVAIRLTYW